MQRLMEIQSVISDLVEMDESAFVNCRQFDDFTDDIMKKLLLVRGMLLTPASSPRLPLSPASLSSPRGSTSIPSPRHIRGLLTPSPSSASSSTSADSWPPDSPSVSTYAAAKTSFDRQIYSRCIQIVEAAVKEGRQVDLAAIGLAHQSYSHMVEETDNEENAQKLVHYWTQFLDSVWSPHLCPVDCLEMLDLQCEALDALYTLDDDVRLDSAKRRLKAVQEAYKIALLIFRPFHLNSLRRLERLAHTIKELRQETEDTEEFNAAHQLYHRALARTTKDRVRYEEETRGTLEKVDTDHAVCCNVLEDLHQIFADDGVAFGRTCSSESEDIVEKVFTEQLVIRL